MLLQTFWSRLVDHLASQAGVDINKGQMGYYSRKLQQQMGLAKVQVAAGSMGCVPCTETLVAAELQHSFVLKYSGSDGILPRWSDNF